MPPSSPSASSKSPSTTPADDQQNEVPWFLKLDHVCVQQDTSSKKEQSDSVKTPVTKKPGGKPLPVDTLGLAFSGGGIRSATFCLGLLQSLARADWLRRVDFLSTVSGGGYLGGFLGRFFDLCAKPGGIMGAFPNNDPGQAQNRVREELQDPQSEVIQWLRKHANYLAPSGIGEALFNVASFWRNFLSIHVVLALFFLGLFGLGAILHYIWPSLDSSVPFHDLISFLAPLSARLPETWSASWAGAVELTAWLVVVPLMIAYWLASQDEHESFVPNVLIALMLVGAAVTLGVGHPLALIVASASILWTLGAWVDVRKNHARGNPQSRFRMALTRNRLTYKLVFWVVVALGLIALTVVDALGQWTARNLCDGGFKQLYARIAAVGGSLGALAVALRGAATFFTLREGKEAGRLSMFAKIPYLPTIMVFLLGGALPLTIISCLTHMAFGLGGTVKAGIGVTVFAIGISWLLGSGACIAFVNRSGLVTIYGARIARAFFGAVNPRRRRRDGASDVTDVVAGDDVPFDNYKPHVAGGPLHIINCAVNETVDTGSERGIRDRQAENLGVGPAAISVGHRWHGLWKGSTGGGDCRLEPLDHRPGERHPFQPKTQACGGGAEALYLRQWISISGAAVSPGMGFRTRPELALLLTLANLRLGYWWDSGLDATERAGVKSCAGWFSLIKKRLRLAFHTQTLLLRELRARFSGPWERYWYLSDGGHFENTGAYELLRRRVPYIIVCDAGQDNRHLGNDLARLARLARVDLGASMRVVSKENELQKCGVPTEVISCLGELQQLLPTNNNLPEKHAVLLSVDYPDAEAWGHRKHSFVLYIKATFLNQDEPLDVKNYQRNHEDFPNESTADQVFDEGQWESYRSLGEHIGGKFFTELNATPAKTKT